LVLEFQVLAAVMGAIRYVPDRADRVCGDRSTTSVLDEFRLVPVHVCPWRFDGFSPTAKLGGRFCSIYRGV